MSDSEDEPLLQEQSACGPTEDDLRKGRLSRGAKALYALPGLPLNALTSFDRLYQAKFWVDDMLMPPMRFAVVSAIVRSLDVFLYPLVGWLVDNTLVQSGWLAGRRRPFFLLSAPLVAMTAMALYAAPSGMSLATKELWLGVVSFLYGIAPLSLPYWALGAEVTSDFNDRTALFGYAQIASNCGAVLGLTVPGLLALLWSGEHRTTFPVYVAVTSLSVVGAFFALARYTHFSLPSADELPALHERGRSGSVVAREEAALDGEAPPSADAASSAGGGGAAVSGGGSGGGSDSNSDAALCGGVVLHEQALAAELTTYPFVASFRASFRLQPFRALLATYIFVSIAQLFLSGLAPFYVQYVLKSAQWELLLGASAVVAVAASLISTPFWMWLSSVRMGGALAAWDKRHTWALAWLLAGGGFLCLGFLRAGQLTEYLAIAAFIGGTAGGTLCLYRSIRADVIDYDTFYTGVRREAQFITVLELVPRWLHIPSSAAFLYMLTVAGYDAGASKQSDAVLAVLRQLSSVLPALCALAAALLAVRLPIGQAEHAVILDGIATHRGGKVDAEGNISFFAYDPLKKAYVPPFGDGCDAVDEDTAWLLESFSPTLLRRFAALLETRDASATASRRPLYLLPSTQQAVVGGAAALLSLYFVHAHSTSCNECGEELLSIAHLLVASVTGALACYFLLRVQPARTLESGEVPPAAIRAYVKALSYSRERPRLPGDGKLPVRS
eukprot:PLAT187.5.p1 GENE.PLAT187.5~~PLAT187.5.p1  ORF type:complete len:743 (+),score=416.52 PLAT187.5:46-2229(+)